MEHLIREFGVWLKQGFGWLIDVFVFGTLWGISQVSRLLGTHLGGAPILNIVALVLVLLVLLYAFYCVFGRFVQVIRWALDRIAYALGVVLFTAAVVSGVFASAGLRCGRGDLGDEHHQRGIAVTHRDAVILTRQIQHLALLALGKRLIARCTCPLLAQS